MYIQLTIYHHCVVLHCSCEHCSQNTLHPENGYRTDVRIPASSDNAFQAITGKS